MVKKINEDTTFMFLIVGLGNPGKKYDLNRHNAGFLFLDFLKQKENLNDFKKKKNFFYSLNNYKNRQIVLLKPKTFMNLSGLAITSAMTFFKIIKENILVVYDDIALPLGKIRIRPKGSDGGHNGLKSIQYQLGTTEYKRIRIGIGAPAHVTGMVSHVLSNFDQDDLKHLNENIFINIKESVDMILDNKINEAMNKYNGINTKED